MPFRVLFVQCVDPAMYPPLIHTAMLMADAGYCSFGRVGGCARRAVIAVVGGKQCLIIPS